MWLENRLGGFKMTWKWPRKILIVVACIVGAWYQTVSAENLSKHDSPNQKTPTIVDVSMDVGEDYNKEGVGIVVFLLDDEGSVWSFKTSINEPPIKLPNLKNIKKLAPFIALDKDGQVFTWALNNNTQVPERNKMEAVFTTPARVEGITNATFIAHAGRHYVVVVNNRDILEWYEIPAQEGFGIEGYGPIRKVYSHDGVKSIAITESSIVALFSDGKILGWGLSRTGQTRKDAIGKQVSFDVLNAEDVYLNKFHTVVLTKDGHTIYFGGCDLDGNDFKRGHNVSFGVVAGAFGLVSDVKAVAMSDNDNFHPDLFLKKDGSVWTAYAPVPPGLDDTFCGFMAKLNGVRHINSTVPAIKIVGGDDREFLVLGVDHQLWIPHYYTGGTQLEKKYFEKEE
jgi:hypothetical protein